MSTVTKPHSLAEPTDMEQPVRKTRTEKEVYQLCGMGFFGSNRIELIDGEILTMSPAGSEHYTAVTLAARLIQGGFGESFVVRVQMGLPLVEGTEPQPDVTAIAGDPRAFTKCQPSSAALVVEVGDTSLKFDCSEKA